MSGDTGYYTVHVISTKNFNFAVVGKFRHRPQAGLLQFDS